MKLRLYFLTAIFSTAFTVPCGASAPARATESQIKAAFLYNFIKFTDWPQSKIAETNTVTIGLLGENALENAFEAVKNKLIKDKRLTIRDFGGFSWFTRTGDGKRQSSEELEQLRKCHLLFISESERENFKTIIEAVRGYDVLTVGETVAFLDAGGIITFIPGTEKPVFEINLVNCEFEGLKISSKVLRLARKVVGEESTTRRNGKD